MGATIWERWIHAARRHHQPRADDQFQPLRAGCCRGLDHRTVGGIAPLEPGYAKVPSHRSRRADLGHGGLETARGLVEVRWRQTGADLTAEAAVPADVTGVIRCRASRGNGRPAHHHHPRHRRGSQETGHE